MRRINSLEMNEEKDGEDVKVDEKNE